MIYLTCVWKRRVGRGCGEGGIYLCMRAVPLPMALFRPMKNERIKFYDIVWACHQLWTKAHTSCPPPSHTHTLPHPPSLSLLLACCASYARTTNKWQSSKSNNNTFHKQKTQSTHTEANTHMHVCVCVNWLKSASGFSSALTWHLPPQCHHSLTKNFPY